MLLNHKHFSPVIALLLVVLLAACHQQESGLPSKSQHKYSLYIRLKNFDEYIVECDDLANGKINPEKEGAPVNIREVARDIIVKDHFYYYLGYKSQQLIKYQIQVHTFAKIDSIAMPDFSIENFKWLGKDSLQLTGFRLPSFTKVTSSLIHTADMKLLNTHSLDIPQPTTGFNTTSIGFAEPYGDDLLVGYTYHKPIGTTSYTTSDTMFTSLVDAKGKLLKTDKDVRSTYPAGVNTVQSYTFYDEQGDYYFMSCPGIALGNRPDIATGIFRIKKGQTAPDKNYFFNLSTSVIKNHAYGLWYLGNGKAIVRSERKDLFHNMNDHYRVEHFEFYLLDLAKQTAKKLDLPLDKGTRRECVLVEGDKAYISINSDKQGNFIWNYDIKTGELKKGLQLTGSVDYIMRIDKL